MYSRVQGPKTKPEPKTQNGETGIDVCVNRIATATPHVALAIQGLQIPLGQRLNQNLWPRERAKAQPKPCTGWGQKLVVVEA